MESAAATADFESQPRVVPTATEPQPEPSALVGEPLEAQTPSIERSWSTPIYLILGSVCSTKTSRCLCTGIL
ncbi:hypothetical protein NADE_009078 [Nannochloris sp. 'desiccata']|nr:hypothetical protein NADE_009078 [Chlorella desiccata (nom. nud.)]